MPHAYMLFAARRNEKKKVPCMSASAAVEQRNLLLRQGWGISMSDHRGMPVSNAMIDGTAKAQGNPKDARAT